MNDQETAFRPVQGSYRDPAGRIFQQDNRIYRAISSHGAEAYDVIKESEFIAGLVKTRRLVPFSEVSIDTLGDAVPFEDAIAVLEHERLNFISYPYEWTFSALQSAALCHLDIHLDALEHNITLIDASAYNIQFQGPNPIFIDHLSFRPYQEGALWDGHRQFCDQFLNPLLLQATRGLKFNEWYRGQMEGISSIQLAELLPKLSYLSLRHLTHVIAPAYFENRLLRQSNSTTASIKKARKLPKSAFKSMLLGLRNWIASLEIKDAGRTQWSSYESDNSYSDTEAQIKSQFVGDFAAQVRPKMLWDLGCNTGYFTSIALSNGAKNVIGFESDTMALEKAFKRAQTEKLNFLPVYQDLVNPSSDQGWKQQERLGLKARQNADGILALALTHHLIIGNNVPLDDAIAWIIGMAPNGIIEFVPRSDPMVEKMLHHRKDIFEGYTEDAFLKSVTSYAKIVRSQHVSKNGRLLVWFSRN